MVKHFSFMIYKWGGGRCFSCFELGIRGKGLKVNMLDTITRLKSDDTVRQDFRNIPKMLHNNLSNFIYYMDYCEIICIFEIRNIKDNYFKYYKEDWWEG